MNHRLLLRFAVIMWAAPLLAASFILLSFALLRSSVFLVSGVAMLAVGGLCLIAGLIAVIAILGTRNIYEEIPHRSYRKPAFAMLGLLLLNLPVALAYTWLGATLVEPVAIEAAPSPSGRYLAEVIHLDEQDQPPYGLAVTLRPAPGAFRTTARSVVFSAYCLKGPTIKWETPERLVIACGGETRTGRRLERYRAIHIRYRK